MATHTYTRTHTQVHSLTHTHTHTHTHVRTQHTPVSRASSKLLSNKQTLSSVDKTNSARKMLPNDKIQPHMLDTAPV